MLYKFLNKTFLLSLFILCEGFSNVPAIWNLSAPNQNFVGRDKYITIIKEKLAKSNVVTVTGFGGLGKSQLVRRFANANTSKYKIVYWFDAQVNMETQLIALAEKYVDLFDQGRSQGFDKMPAKKKIDYITNKLRTCSDNWLLIFDNAEDYKSVSSFFVTNQNRALGHIIVTSRNKNRWRSQLSLRSFARGESIALIKAMTGSNQDKLASRLAELLKDYPLAIARACAYIKKFSSLKSYINLYENQRSELLQKTGSIEGLLNDYYFTSYATIALSLKKIRAVSEDAWSLILCLSLLKNINIPMEYIQSWVDKFTKGSKIFDLIAQVQAQSLLEQSPSNRKLFNLHELVSEIIKQQIPKGKRRKYIAQSVNILLSSFTGRSDEMVKKMINNRHHIYHAEELLRQVSKSKMNTPEIIALKIALVECYVHMENRPGILQLMGEVDAAIKANRHGWQGFFPQATKIEAVYYLHKCRIVSAMYANYTKAIEYAKKAFKILISIEDKEQEKIRPISRVVLCATLMGDLKTAQEFAVIGDHFFKYCPSTNDRYVFLYAKLMSELLEGDINKIKHTAKKFDKYYKQMEYYIPQQIYGLGLKLAVMNRIGDYDDYNEVMDEYIQKTKMYYGSEVPEFKPVAVAKFVAVSRLIENHPNYKQAGIDLKAAQEMLNRIYHGPTKVLEQAEVGNVNSTAEYGAWP